MSKNTLVREQEWLALLEKAICRLKEGYAALPETHETILDDPAIETILLEAAERLHDNFPYFHPLYAGQMLKPPHPIAQLAYCLATFVNPNNHALDGGRASSRMEKEAVAELARLFSWSRHLGHLTSGGTMANLEALWIAGKLHPGKQVLASSQAHYTHNRISQVLGLTFTEIPVDSFGRMDMEALEKELEKGDVGTVVATIGTTAIGAVDPLQRILDLQKRIPFRIHADAAYGGYFRLASELAHETTVTLNLLHLVDSLVIDPHKHGLQPYGCGCILFRDPSVGRFYKHDSPYTYFSSTELHLGEISLECSRPGAAAVALWATQRYLPLVAEGKFARMLTHGRQAALGLHKKLLSDARFIVPFSPELDIVIWAVRAPSVSQASQKARLLFEEAGRNNLHLALANLPVSFFQGKLEGVAQDQETITCLRSVLMKPEHLDWIESLWGILQSSIQSSIQSGSSIS